jgi:nitrogen fixation NifU-like protein
MGRIESPLKMKKKKKSPQTPEELERFTRQLQDQIMEQIRKRYSETVIEHWQNPKNFRKMDNPDGFAQVKGSCGDTMEMFVRMKDNKILECTFQTDGCGTTIACGSLATGLAQDKTFIQAMGLVSADEILKRLGGLPASDVHCAQLAAETLRRALADNLHHKKYPWKKHYRET